MASVQRGRGRGGRGGGPDGSQRRGSWRGGPPGSNGNGNGTSRTNSPIISGPPTNGPRQSINDHFTDLRKVDDKSRKGFQTDSDISGSAGPKMRELKPWSPNEANTEGQAARTVANGGGGAGAAHRESETFGPAPTGAWDQFETNKRLFGTGSTWDENLYTTKLDKSAPDYKIREKEADRLAAEIMGQTASNPHIAEERNQTVQGANEMDEEEKYSGVARNPNAYVPPAARKTQGGFAAAAARGQAAAVAAKPNGRATPTGPAAAATPPPAKTPQPSAAPMNTSASTNAAVSVAPAKADDSLSVPQPIQPTRSTSDGPTAVALTVSDASPSTDKSAPPAEGASMVKTESKDGAGVLDSFRRFVGTERERVEAKKQSMQKSERERQLADLKKFKDSFKVALPVPKDMLSILSKDEAKQKEIEAKAAQTVIEEQRAHEARKLASPKVGTGAAAMSVKSPSSAKKPAMKIQEIPTFDALKKKKPPTLPVPETAGQNIALATSPSPSDASASTQTKLNPKATTFSFKPNPSAATFKPGQPSSSVTSPQPQATPTLPSAPAAAAGPSQPQTSTAAAGPSTAYKNPFFSSKPRQVTVNVREDFHPWKHGQVPPASVVSPQWPYTGRKYTTGYPMGGPMSQMDDDMVPGPGPMPGMPPQYPPFYRYGMPQTPGMGPTSPMFSPNHGYAALPGQPMHMGGPPQPNAMPMYYPNGMPNPHFMPPHQMQYNPQMQPRQGPPGGPNQGPPPQGPPPGGPPPMFFHNAPPQIPTPQHTPHVQSNLPFPSQSGQFGQIPPNVGSPLQHNTGNSGQGEGQGQA